jgi:cold-inducible RNA-binding protein
MAKKLYVGNLSYGTTSESLKAGFERAGAVSDAVVLMDKMTGRSRGFGFVTMEDADADKAVAMFDGQDFEGRNIKVNEARPMEERPRGGSSFGGGAGARRSF